jgi:hypothetical protein
MMLQSSESEKWFSSFRKFLCGADDLLSYEERSGFLFAVGAFNFENGKGIVLRISAHRLFFLDFVVKIPFVDLDPGKASLLHGLVFHLAGWLSVVFIKDSKEHVNLVVGLPASVVHGLLEPRVDHASFPIVAVSISR